MPPAVRRSTRSACRAAPAECVTSRQALPLSRQRATSASSTAAAVSGSRLPVGSSASSSAGWCTSARAMATRCSCPPLSCAGRRAASAPRPTASRAERTRAESGRPSRRRGSSTLSATLRCGSTWKAWKTKPRRWRRSRADAASDNPVTSVSPIHTRPLSGASSPAMQFRSVDLPTPDSPTSATNSPGRSSRLTPRKTGWPS